MNVIGVVILTAVLSLTHFMVQGVLLNADTTVDLEVHSKLTTVYSTLTLVRNRIGFVDHNSMWRRRIYTHVVYFNFFSGIHHFYDAVAALFGVTHIKLNESENHLREQISIFQSSDSRVPTIEKPYIAIGMGCSDLGKERELPLEHWAVLLKRIHQINESWNFVFLGSQSDRLLAEKIKDLVPSKNFCGELSILGSCAILKNAIAFIGIDSFLLHAARALCKNVVGFWGPTAPSTRLRSSTCVELQSYLSYSCSPCIHREVYPPCKGQNQCMKEHNLDLVVEFFKTSIGKTKPFENYSGHAWAFHPDQKRPQFIKFLVGH